MPSALDIKLSQIAQAVIPLDEGTAWFDQLDQPARLNALQALYFFVSQSRIPAMNVHSRARPPRSGGEAH